MVRPEDVDTYSPATGLVYIFNLIVGTGALTMPAAFAHAGWLMSITVITLLCLMSFVTVTFVIESMSIANAVMKTQPSGSSRSSSRSSSQSKELTTRKNSATNSPELTAHEESDELPSTSFAFPNDEKLPLMCASGNHISTEGFQDQSRSFDITQRVEMGQMANMFFPPIAVFIFYLCIAAYLYGDLAIYAAAIGKSLRDVTCTWRRPCNGNSSELYQSDPCWPDSDVSRTEAYRMFVALVLVCLGPFAFFNVQKTKYLQLLTTLFRWFSFTSMIVLASIALIGGKGRGNPPPARLSGLPNLFGVCVYSFMCHHSLPGMITPINKKGRIYWLVFADYLLILVFYSLLSFTGAFAFDSLDDIYTLNFQKDKCSTGPKDDIVPSVTFLQYFLPLFPVFTLSTSFPIISITLTNNLKALLMPYFVWSTPADTVSLSTNTAIVGRRSRSFFFVDRLLFPLLAIAPPVILALATEDLQVLVGIVGSYAGASIQYIIPALLIYYARRCSPVDMNDDFVAGEGLKVKKAFRSPFRHRLWIPFVLLWAAVCVAFVTVDHIIG